MDYSKITDQDFDRILRQIIEEEGGNILLVPNIYSELAEFYGNEVLDRWADEQTAIGDIDD